MKEYNGKINYSLNVIKCIAIFAVICIHCGFTDGSFKGSVIDSLSRFAVPVFFLISGFFSYYEDNNYAINKYKTRIIRLIKLYIIATLLYFAFYWVLGSFTSLNDIINLFSLDACFNYLIFNLNPAVIHLWFISALLYCYIFFYIIRKFNADPKSFYVYIPIGLFVSLLFGEFSHFFGWYIPNECYRNFLFMGLPFFTLGYLIHDKRENLTTVLSNLDLFVLMILGLLLTIFEANVVGKYDLYIGTIVFTLCLFIWCIKNPNRLDFKIIGWIGQNLYSLMYILHMLVLTLWGLYGSDLGYLNPFVIFIITALISGIIYVIEEHIKKFKLFQ